jgi:hypothetical protein
MLIMSSIGGATRAKFGSFVQFRRFRPHRLSRFAVGPSRDIGATVGVNFELPNFGFEISSLKRPWAAR